MNGLFSDITTSSSVMYLDSNIWAKYILIIYNSSSKFFYTFTSSVYFYSKSTFIIWLAYFIPINWRYKGMIFFLSLLFFHNVLLLTLSIWHIHLRIWTAFIMKQAMLVIRTILPPLNKACVFCTTNLFLFFCSWFCQNPS